MNRLLQFCVVCVLLLPAVAVDVTVQEASHDEGNTSIKFTATHGERYRIVVFADALRSVFPKINLPSFASILTSSACS